MDIETMLLPMDISGKRHHLKLNITEILKHEIILGIPQLQASNPRVNWRNNQLYQDTLGSRSVTKKRLYGTLNKPERTLRIFVITKESKLSLKRAIPEEYRQYNKLFSDELETGLLEYSQQDHKITLQPGKELGFHKMYPLNKTQQKALDKYLNKNLRKGYIRPLVSLAGYLILFVPKKNRKL